MAILNITRQQYRDLAEIVKKEAGMCLNLSSFSQMGKWGEYSPWAMPVYKDVTDPETAFDEAAFITLSRSIDTERLRHCGASRPELDWGELEDHEIFPFIVWHEIGHRVDNFDPWGIMGIKDDDTREKCRRRAGFVNEVLADRFAWGHIRPGEPIPISQYGEKWRKSTEFGLAYLQKHAPTNGKKLRNLEPGA